MKWVDDFRRPGPALALRGRLQVAARGLGPVTLMEVCGTHTMAIARHGLRRLLPPNVRLVSGPGCPVCVTPVSYVDQALALARKEGLTVATFGDMVRVPGSTGSLAEASAAGARVEVVTSTLDALRLARQDPGRQVVFLAVGFETTTPTVAAALRRARQEGLRNLSVLCGHKTIPAALAALASSPGSSVDGFLCPGHVSVIIGTRPYAPLNLPCVVGGFEPLDILLALALLLEQLARGEARVQNAYGRAVREEGNALAQQVAQEVFEPCDADWRGLGPIPGSGLRLRAALADLEASLRFGVPAGEAREPPGCRCGEVLCGTVTPRQCPLFGAACTPAHPVGACMVSSEGSCAASHRYGGGDA